MKILLLEIIYLLIIKINIMQFANPIYNAGIDVIQFLYFFAFFIVYLYISIRQKKTSSLLRNATIFLIFYSIFLHFLLEKIATNFTNVSGTINFIQYAGKIYFICLPLISFRIWAEKNNSSKKFFIFVKIILFCTFAIFLQKLFGLNGTLYCVPFCEFVYFCQIIFKCFTHNKN